MCCFHILQTMLCTQHRIHCVDQHCITLYVLYSVMDVINTIIGCVCLGVGGVRVRVGWLVYGVKSCSVSET